MRIALTIMVRVWCKEGDKGERERGLENNTLHFVEIFWVFSRQCE